MFTAGQGGYRAGGQGQRPHPFPVPAPDRRARTGYHSNEARRPGSTAILLWTKDWSSSEIGLTAMRLTAGTAAAVIAGFWLAGPESRRPPSSTPQPTSAAAVTKVVCSFLTSGDLSSAYHLTTAEFQNAVTLTAFAHAVSGQPAPELRAGSASCGTAQPDGAVLPTSPATPEASRTPTEGDTTALATAYLPAANSPQWTSRITLRKKLDNSWRITGLCGDHSRSAGTTPTNSGMVASEETCVG